MVDGEGQVPGPALQVAVGVELVLGTLRNGHAVHLGTHGLHGGLLGDVNRQSSALDDRLYVLRVREIVRVDVWLVLVVLRPKGNSAWKRRNL